MAYTRGKKTRRSSYGRRTARGTSSYARRSKSRSGTSRRRNSGRGSQTIRIVVEQPQALPPLGGAMQTPEPPKKGKF